MFTHRKHEKITLNINGQDITIENSAKFSGLTFDSKLSWSAHIKYIEDKCKKRINLMRAVSGNAWGASKKTLLTIYRALIRSIIDHGAITAGTLVPAVLMATSHSYGNGQTLTTHRIRTLNRLR